MVAFCYLRKENDKKHLVFISEEALTLVYGSRKHDFPVDQVVSMALTEKQRVLPLVWGGLLASFMFLALFSQTINPWIGLVAGLGGLMLFYLGWLPSPILTIQTYYKSFDFNIDAPAPNLVAFSEFVNFYVQYLKGAELKFFTNNKHLEASPIPVFPPYQVDRLPDQEQASMRPFIPVHADGEIKYTQTSPGKPHGFYFFGSPESIRNQWKSS